MYTLVGVRPSIAVLAALAMLATACGSDSAGTSVEPGATGSSNALVGETFKIVAADLGDGEVPAPTGTTPTIRVREGSIEGDAGCNTYTFDGSFQADGSAKFMNLSITEMACLDRPDWFEMLDVISAASDWEQTDDLLTVRTDDGRTVIAGRATTGEPDDDDGAVNDPNPSNPANGITEQVIGLSEESAIEAIEGFGWVARVVGRDGESYPVTADYSESRVNLTIVDGNVTEATIG